MQDLPLKILFLADDAYNADVVRDHIQAFFCYSRFQLTLLNPCHERAFLNPLAQYDAVVIHYSIFILSNWHLPEQLAAAIRDFRGLKVQIIQDEYRQVDAMAERMGWLGIDLIFTILQGDAVAQGYPQACIAGAIKHSVNVTGFTPKHLLQYPRRPLAERPYDIVYRGRDVPFFLGRLGQEKLMIGKEVQARAATNGLAVDIAWEENARIYGDAWYDFIASGRTALATESGSSIWDFTGAIERDVAAYCSNHPGAAFEEVFDRFLAPHEGKIPYRAASPRLFEALCLGTALVMFPGHYSGMFVPDRHYILLQKDFSNFKDVVAQLRDHRHLEQMVTRARDEIIFSGVNEEATYVADFDAAIAAAYQARIKTVPVLLRPHTIMNMTFAPLASDAFSASGHGIFQRTGRKMLYFTVTAVEQGAQELTRRLHLLNRRRDALRLGRYYFLVRDFIRNVCADRTLSWPQKGAKIVHRSLVALQRCGGGLVRRCGQIICRARLTPGAIHTPGVQKYRCRHSGLQRLQLCARCGCNPPPPL